MAETHQFVALGFEAGGGFGPATLRFLQDVEKVAGEQSSADLYHWSAMMWGEHWRRQLSLELARGQVDMVLGQVDLVLGVVLVAWSNLSRAKGRQASAEWSSTDCQPCVSLQ